MIGDCLQCLVVVGLEVRGFRFGLICCWGDLLLNLCVLYIICVIHWSVFLLLDSGCLLFCGLFHCLIGVYFCYLILLCCCWVGLLHLHLVFCVLCLWLCRLGFAVYFVLGCLVVIGCVLFACLFSFILLLC